MPSNAARRFPRGHRLGWVHVWALSRRVAPWSARQWPPASPPPILHVDMDAFYASVEQRDRPELRGKPVIVGGLRGRGVVCAASYEAGRSAFTGHAHGHGAASVPGPTSCRRHAALRRGRPTDPRGLLRLHAFVEPLSLDEAFLDVRGRERLFGPSPDIARQIKDRIKAETGLIASVGVAPNKFLAKLASDFKKPDGLFVLRPSR